WPREACSSGAGKAAFASRRTCTAMRPTSTASSTRSTTSARLAARRPPVAGAPPRGPGPAGTWPFGGFPRGVASGMLAPDSPARRTRMDALLSLSNDLAAAVEQTAPSILAVHARHRLPSTGIHWRPGIVVTAEHTVRAEDGITVTAPAGRSLPAPLAGRDRGTDLAVLRVPDLGTAPATLGDDSTLRVGYMVLALGHGPRASWGVISALGPRWGTWRGGDVDRLIRLDLVMYPGFSGGPLVDASGRVVGLNTSRLARDMRHGVAVCT